MCTFMHLLVCVIASEVFQHAVLSRTSWFKSGQCTFAGVHVTLPDYYSPEHLGMIVPKTKDGRVVFMLPWLEATIAGTTGHCSHPLYHNSPAVASCYILCLVAGPSQFSQLLTLSIQDCIERPFILTELYLLLADSNSEITMQPQPTEKEIQFILDAIAEYLTVKVNYAVVPALLYTATT